MLGTNLSIQSESGKWELQTDRLLMMTKEEFPNFGIGINDLIEGYVQTLLGVIAIDSLCQRLCPKDKFDINFFSKINSDLTLIQELFVQSFDCID